MPQRCCLTWTALGSMLPRCFDHNNSRNQKMVSKNQTIKAVFWPVCGLCESPQIVKRPKFKSLAIRFNERLNPNANASSFDKFVRAMENIEKAYKPSLKLLGRPKKCIHRWLMVCFSKAPIFSWFIRSCYLTPINIKILMFLTTDLIPIVPKWPNIILSPNLQLVTLRFSCRLKLNGFKGVSNLGLECCTLLHT